MVQGVGRCLLVVIALCVGTVGNASAQSGGEDDDWGDEGSPTVEIHGFVETAAAARVTEDDTQPDDVVLGEVRFRLDLSHYSDRSDFTFKGDFTADDVTRDVEIEIRQAVITFRARDWLDVRAGRQILTWGTGDFVFLNDLFPKDFVSFFTGREDEYLKAPSNSVKFTVYSGVVNTDIVWTPVFEPDGFITGERLSFFDPSAPGIVSSVTMGQLLETVRPPRQLEDGELAARVFRTIGGYEVALYGYVGFSKQPEAFDAGANLPTHSRLAVYGGSVRSNLFGGIGSLEGAYYDSFDDRRGDDSKIPNSEVRGLAGYERELFANFTAGLQYYVEWIQEYRRLITSSPAPAFEGEEARHTVTARLTYRLFQQTLTLSMFAFVSPNEEDVHLRPLVSHKWSDSVSIAAGANIMLGDDPTFFGQLQDNSNGYVRIRYSF
jgi:hypothetical protein